MNVVKMTAIELNWIGLRAQGGVCYTGIGDGTVLSPGKRCASPATNCFNAKKKKSCNSIFGSCKCKALTSLCVQKTRVSERTYSYIYQVLTKGHQVAGHGGRSGGVVLNKAGGLDAIIARHTGLEDGRGATSLRAGRAVEGTAAGTAALAALFFTTRSAGLYSGDAVHAH